MTLFIYTIPILVLLVTLVMAFTILSYLTMEEEEMVTPFECGEDNLSTSRSPFSVRFFLLAVVFLVFDIETALLLPLPMVNMQEVGALSGLLLFLLILMLGLAHEWRENTLLWAW